jgi:putative transcriptional regulator
VSASHHPSDAVLAAYAAGGLKVGFDLVVAAHLEACPTCRRGVRSFETAGGGLLGSIEPVAMHEDSLSHALARLEREPSPTPPPAPPADRRRLVERLPLGRRRWLAPGAWVQPVAVDHDPADRVYLLRVGPGVQTIHHAHAGPEFTYVISGALKDDGVVLHAGDFCERDTEHVHQPTVMPGQGCLCLVATQGSIIGQDWASRLIQKFAGV